MHQPCKSSAPLSNLTSWDTHCLGFKRTHSWHVVNVLKPVFEQMIYWLPNSYLLSSTIHEGKCTSSLNIVEYKCCPVIYKTTKLRKVQQYGYNISWACSSIDKWQGLKKFKVSDINKQINHSFIFLTS